MMKKLKFPLNCIELFINDSDLKSICQENLTLTELFDKNVSINTEEYKTNFSKNIKIKLFNFLHDLFIDQIFLGNELFFLIDEQIHWNAKDEKFFIKCMIILTFFYLNIS
jgi:hypothetical protein